jgi:hypothetical protein
LEITYDEVDMTAIMGDTVKGYMRNHPQVSPGTLNAVFDNTATTGLHALTVTPNGTIRNIMVPIGMRTAPVDGDPVFCGQFTQTGYNATNDGGAVTATLQFAGWAGNATSLNYAMPWGQLLHAKAIRLSATGVNTDAGFMNDGGVVSTTRGGFFMYQVFAGNGTATLSVEDSDDWDDPADYDATVATTALLNCALPQAGIIASSTMTIREGLRWQIAFTSATTVTFACGFCRVY